VGGIRASRGDPFEARERRERWGELSGRFASEFERRALIPRLLVLVVLGLGALLEYGHGYRVAHWVVLIVYGATTIALALSARQTSQSWLPWVATTADAALTVYVIGDHLPRDAHDALHASDAVSLLPAFLLLLQTGLRLRRDLVALFATLVAGGWMAALAMFFGSDLSFVAVDGMSVATRQVHSLVAFLAASAIVFYAVHQMRRTVDHSLRARLDRLLLSRFLPEGVAAEVVRGDDRREVAERHVCLLMLDIRGFSAYARERPSHEVISTLMNFRRHVHDTVSAHHGTVDKYLGDGVLALFLEGSPQMQAERALEAVQEILRDVTSRNGERAYAFQPKLRVIAALHSGSVLAGVFDDGRRAEFTVLGPAMNALSRIERRAKEAEVDILASKKFVRLLPPQVQGRLVMHPLARRKSDCELPDTLSLELSERASTGLAAQLNSKGA
jgi:adenylate cyclase